MDLLMETQSFESGVPSAWDFALKAGVPQTLEGSQELGQRATIAAYIEKNTVPGREDSGVDWQGYLTGGLNPRELDAEIRNSMYWQTGTTRFIPYYYVKNSKLQLSIQEAQDGN